jgi:hypothetical protein
MKMQGFGIMMKPPVQEVTDNPIKYFSLKTKTFIGIIDLIMMLQTKYEHVFISQGTLAQYLGVKRETINRIIKQMVRDGILKKISQGFKKSCIYKLNPYFFCHDIKSKLRMFFKTLRIIPLFLLTPFSLGHQSSSSHNITLFKNLGYKEIYINNKHRVQTMKTEALKKLKFIQNLESLKGIDRNDLIKLFAFPEQGLLFCDDKVLMVKNVRKPFNLFMDILLDWMLWNDFQPNWSYVNELKSLYGSNLDELFNELTKTQYKPTRSPLRPPVVKNKYENQPRSTIKIKPYIPPVRILIDTQEENKAREEARKSIQWQECERILGITINPPIPEFVVKRS